jgi:4-hydroxyproline epimerase
MCGHGLMGVVETLRHLGRIQTGKFQFETPVGVVTAELHADGRVTIANVASYRHAAGVALDVPGYGRVHGDIAWGGNWFFLVDDHGLVIALDNIPALMRCTSAIREALDDSPVRGRDGALIDHVELIGAGTDGADSRNFVLCPGHAYDRSPCGTGTSAKLACLAADGKLAPDTVWRQQSVIGSEFQASYRRLDADTVQPLINGRAHVVAESVLVFDLADPFAWGFA